MTYYMLLMIYFYFSALIKTNKIISCYKSLISDSMIIFTSHPIGGLPTNDFAVESEKNHICNLNEFLYLSTRSIIHVMNFANFSKFS